MYHDIEWSGAGVAAQIAIEKTTLIVTAGAWPDFGKSVSMPAAEVPLVPEDRYVYLDRDGGIVVSDEFVPYGQDGQGNANEMLDLLAWREGEEWHIKRLVPPREE
jgi:hypothetical protein